jgi:hypothetical protein
MDGCPVWKVKGIILVEEGEDVGAACGCYLYVEDLDPPLHSMAALVAFVARKYASNKATPEVAALRQRMSFHLLVIFHTVFKISITATQKLNAAVGKIYEGERDKDALLSTLTGQKKAKSLELQ